MSSPTDLPPEPTSAFNPVHLALHAVIAAVCLLTPAALVAWWVDDAKIRLAEIEAAPEEAPAVAVASAADEGYCTGDLKKVLRRVLQSCGLSPNGARGCQPLAAKQVATLSGSDFNAMFAPLEDRAGILLFDQDSSELDAGGQALAERMFADRRGASYFFVVARASPEGSEIHNRGLSQRRGEAVLSYLEEKFQDPDLDQQVGLLWLGEEFAQLDEQTFCGWPRSREGECDPRELNRSAFVAWIDCRL
jgi:outer membrane protein OmpA-like peptidoglycan-associated protein